MCRAGDASGYGSDPGGSPGDQPGFLDTPLYRCEALEPGLGCTVSIKLETANPVRSFKARGTEVVASLLADIGSRAVVCASAGNLGQALAWSGRGRGLEVTVVASRFAPTAKLDRIRALDARLELVDGDFDMARTPEVVWPASTVATPPDQSRLA